MYSWKNTYLFLKRWFAWYHTLHLQILYLKDFSTFVKNTPFPALVYMKLSLLGILKDFDSEFATMSTSVSFILPWLSGFALVLLLRKVWESASGLNIDQHCYRFPFHSWKVNCIFRTVKPYAELMLRVFLSVKCMRNWQQITFHSRGCCPELLLVLSTQITAA